ncbi:MAG: sulfatase-like hydrolase/transferase [Planctomycetota bacterium]
MTDARDAVELTANPSSIRPLVYAFCCPIIAAVLFAAADLFWAKQLVPIALDTSEKILIAVHGLGLHVFVGMLLGLIQVLILVVCPRKIGKFDGRVLGFTLFFSALFVHANWDIADGAGIVKSSVAPILKWGTRLGGPLAIWIALGILKKVLGPFCRRRDPWFFAVVLGLGFAAATLVASRYNMAWLPGRYPGIHIQMTIAAILCAQSAVFLVMRWGALRLDVSKKPIIVFALALVTIVASVLVLRADRFVPLRSSVYSVVPGTTPFRPALDQLFGRFIKQVELTEADVREERQRQIAAGKIDVSKILDKLPNRKNYNLLVIALDTLRWDRTTNSGYSKHPTTPNLQKLVDEGAFQFNQAYTPYPTSNYAYSSFLTGMHAGATPLHLWRGYKKKWEGSEEVYFPKLFSNRGIHSLGIFAFALRDRANQRYFGMVENGFDAFNPDQKADNAMAGHEITASLLKHIKQRPTKRFFAMAHYMEAHVPYLRWPQYDFGSSKSDRYDSEIAYVDNELGRVINFMKKEGLWDDTILVVLSDHGEALGDHTFVTHNSSLYECELRVPLVIRIPGLPGREVEAAVALTDVIPSLLEVMKIDDPVKRLGLPMLPYLLGYEDLPTRTVFSELYSPRQTMSDLEQRAVIYGRHKLIKILTKPVSNYELYDLSVDAGETRSLFGRPEAAEIQAKLLGFMTQIAKETKEIIGGIELLEPEELLERDLTAALEELKAANGRTQTIPAGGKISSKLRNRYDSLNVLTKLLDPALMDDIRRTALAKAMAELPRSNHQMLKILNFLPHPDNVAYGRALLKDRADHIRYGGALMMARQGGEGSAEAKELLMQRAKATGDPVARFDAAIALAELGDFSWLDYYTPFFRGHMFGESTWQLGPLLLAFTKAKHPGGLKTLAERIVLNQLNDYTLRSRTIEYARAIPNDDSERILLCLSFDLDSGLKVRARAALSERFGQKIRDEKLERYQLEYEGMDALFNGLSESTIDNYKRYIAKYPDYSARVDFDLARTYAEMGNRAEAKKALEHARSVGNEEQKIAAKRWLKHIGDLRWHFQKSDLRGRVEMSYEPSMMKRNRAYGMKVKLTNESDVFWPGGTWGFGLLLRAWIVDDEDNIVGKVDGRLVTARAINNFLPLSGVAPGETIELILAGHAPSGKWKDKRIALALCQNSASHLPDDRDFFYVGERRYSVK